MLQTSFSVEEHEQLRALIAGQRQAALATLHQGRPAISMVTYAQDPDGNFLLHLSALAQHTSDLLARPELALLICEPDTGARNPQTLQRLSIEGRALLLKRDSAEYEAAKTIALLGTAMQQATSRLQEVAENDPVPQVRDAAAEALTKVKQQ